MKSFDPLTIFIEKIGMDISTVKDFIIGERYVAVILNNGNIGLAANIINLRKLDFKSVELFDNENTVHRLFLLAYFNAVLNNRPNQFSKGDIFECINFEKYENTVMIGYSVPMFEKLKQRNCRPFVFDDHSDDKIIIKQDLIPKYLQLADALILTGTSVINNTFKDIIKQVNRSCDIFLIGPSATLSELLLSVKNIKGIFGTKFSTDDKNVLKIIKQNEGTNYLKKYGQKLILLKN